MKALLIYAHLLVIYFVASQMFSDDEHTGIRVFGAVNVVWVVIFAYMYAMWSLWQIVSN